MVGVAVVEVADVDVVGDQGRGTDLNVEVTVNRTCPAEDAPGADPQGALAQRYRDIARLAVARLADGEAADAGFPSIAIADD